MDHHTPPILGVKIRWTTTGEWVDNAPLADSDSPPSRSAYSERKVAVIGRSGTPNWYGLGPVSVLPEYQRKGIGKALIKEDLSRLNNLNAQGCCLVGHPDYYRKVGFENISGIVHEGVPQEVFLALSFDGHIPHGTVAFHEGFKADGQQGAEGDVANRAP